MPKLYVYRFLWLLFFSVLFNAGLNDVLGQSCQGFDGAPSPNGGPQKVTNGSLCVNQPVTPGEIMITASNVDDADEPTNFGVEIDWGDGSARQTIDYPGNGGVVINWGGPGSHSYTIPSITHTFLPGECVYRPTVYLRIDGTTCPIQFGSSPDFNRFNTDDQPTGQLDLSETVSGANEFLVCEGTETTLTFTDRTTLNCLPPENIIGLNSGRRWRRFVYGTSSSITGNVLINGALQAFPFDGSVETSTEPLLVSNPPFADNNTLSITIPASAREGEIFELRLDYWNFCNQFTDGDAPVSIPARVRVVRQPPAPAPVNNVVCTEETLPNFQVNFAGASSLVNWYEDNGGAPGNLIPRPFAPNSKTLPATNYPGGIDNALPGTYTVWAAYVAVANADGVSCESEPVPITLTILENSPTVGANQAHCGVLTSDPLGANIPVTGTGEWSVASRPPGTTVNFVPDIFDPNALASVSDPGLYTFRWTITNGSCVRSADILVDFGVNTVTAAAGVDNSFCGLSGNLNATVPLIGTGAWTQTGGPGTAVFVDASDPSTAITVDQTGTYDFTWTVTSGSCTPPAQDIVLITFTPLPTALSLTPDVCDEIAGAPFETTVDLSVYEAAVTNNAPNRMVTWYENAPPPTGVLIPSLQPVQTGTTYYAHVQNTNTLCTNDASVTFTVHELPSATDATEYVCEDSQGSNQATGIDLNHPIYIEAVAGTGGNVTIRWFDSEAEALSDVGAILAPVNIAGSRTFFARVINIDPPSCWAVARLDVVVNSRPANQPILGKETVCMGDLELYQVSPVTGARYFWDIPDGAGEFEIFGGGGEDDFFVLLSFPNLHNNSISVTVELNGCAGTQLQKPVTVSPTPQPFQVVRTDIDPLAPITTDVVCRNDTGIPYAVVPNNYSSSTYNWEIRRAVDDSPGGGIVANGQTTGNVLINFLTEDVIIRVRESNASNCAGPLQQVFVTVNASPVMTDPGKEVCSDEATAIVFQNTLTSPVPADRYDIFGVTYATGLVPITGPSNGSGAANMIANDAFENQGNVPLTVRYNVTPVSVDAVTGKECAGPSQVVTLTVKPKPKLAPNLNKVVCSEEETHLTLFSAPNTFPADKFIIEDIETNGLTPLTGLPTLFTQLDGDAIYSNRFENTTGVEVPVIYSVRPYSTVLSCEGNPAVDVLVTVFPKALVNPINQPPICSGDKLNIQLSSSMPDATFLWSIKSITGNIDGAKSGQGTAIEDVLINNNLTQGRVVYEVRTKNPSSQGDCLGPPTDIEVIVNPFKVDFQVVGPVSQCTGGEFTFSWNVEQGVRYTWIWSDFDQTVIEPGDLPLGTQQVSHAFTSGSTQSATIYSVRLLGENGSCTPKEAIRQISVFPSLFLKISQGDPILCSGESITFNNESEGVDTHRWYYRETGTSNVIDERFTDQVEYVMENLTTQDPVIYEVVYEASNSEGCFDTYTKEVKVYKSVTASFDTGEVPPLRGGVSEVTFTNTSAPVDESTFEYEWDFGGNSATPATGNGAGPFTVTYSTADGKSVTLRAFNRIALALDNKLCESEERRLILIPVETVQADFRAYPMVACFPADIVIENNSPGADSFVWQLYGTRGLISESTLREPTFRISSPGTYSIKLTATYTATSQVDIAQVEGIEIFDMPFAEFGLSATTIFIPDTELITYNESTMANTYSWNFGDGTVSTEFEPTHLYQAEGSYVITLAAGYDHGEKDLDGDGELDENVVCYDTAYREVITRQGGTVKIPNAFTPSPFGPNGGVDGGSGSINDVFLPLIDGVEEFEMQVYDRWGTLIFESKQKNIGWDGYDRNGRLLPAGVYVYKLVLRLANGERSTQIGDVTLIR